MFEYFIEKLNDTNYDETVILGTLLVILESNVDKYQTYFDSNVFGSSKTVFEEEFQPEFDGIFGDTERNIFTDVVAKMLLDTDVIVDMTFSFKDFTIVFDNKPETFEQKFINLAQVFYEMQFCGDKLTGVTDVTDLRRIHEIMVIVENILMAKQKSLQVVYFNNKFLKKYDRMKAEEFPSSNVDFQRVAAVKDLKKKVSVQTSSDIKHQIIILDDPKMEVDKINKLIELCNVDTVMILVGIDGAVTSTNDFVHIKKIIHSPSVAPPSVAPSSVAPSSVVAPIRGGAVENDVEALKTKIIDALLSLYTYFLEKQGFKVIRENKGKNGDYFMKGGSLENWIAFVLAIIFCIGTISATNTSSPNALNDDLDAIIHNPDQSVNLLYKNNFNAIKSAFALVKQNRIHSNPNRVKRNYNTTALFDSNTLLPPNVATSSEIVRSLGEIGGEVAKNFHLDIGKLEGLIKNINSTPALAPSANTATSTNATDLAANATSFTSANTANTAEKNERLRQENENTEEAANKNAAEEDQCDEAVDKLLRKYSDDEKSIDESKYDVMIEEGKKSNISEDKIIKCIEELEYNVEKFEDSLVETSTLFIASENGNKEEVEFLIKNGDNVNQATTDNGRTPLYIASEYGHQAVVEVLIANGAKVDQATTDNGQTPLYIASSEGHKEIVEVLLAKGAIVNQATTYDGQTPLFTASLEGHTEVVEVLLAKGANVDQATTDNGQTPLYIASNNRHKEVVEVLLAKGANVDQATTDNGQTPLYIASSEGHKEIVEVLLAKGAIVNQATTDNGQTPLYIASENGHQAVVEVLINNGAKVDQATIHNRQTPLFAASQYGHQAVVEVLLAKGANVNKKNNDGKTPLMAASTAGHKDVVDYLIKHGANFKETKVANRSSPQVFDSDKFLFKLTQQLKGYTFNIKDFSDIGSFFDKKQIGNNYEIQPITRSDNEFKFDPKTGEKDDSEHTYYEFSLKGQLDESTKVVNIFKFGKVVRFMGGAPQVPITLKIRLKVPIKKEEEEEEEEEKEKEKEKELKKLFGMYHGCDYKLYEFNGEISDEEFTGDNLDTIVRYVIFSNIVVYVQS
jgi:ankyrin repeat protein